MPSFDSLSALEKFIKEQVYEVVKEDVANEGEEKLDKAIDDTVYSRPGGDRTGEFKKSVDSETLRSGNGVHLTIFNNPEKMAAHPSWQPEKYGDNQNQWLTNWLNYGHGGMAEYEEQLFIEKTREEFSKTAKKVLKKGLIKRGIDAK